MVAAPDTPQQKRRAILTLYKPYISKQKIILMLKRL